MGAGWYEVAVREPGRDVGEVRRWTAEEIARALPWLKRANARGRDVLIRPAAVVEAEPGQLQAWVRVPACDAARREAIGRQLAREQGVDPRRAVPGLYGRLAGFTNREAGDERRQPWVLCRESSGREARAGAALVKVAGQEVEFRAQVARERRARQQAQERGRERGGLSR